MIAVISLVAVSAASPSPQTPSVPQAPASADAQVAATSAAQEAFTAGMRSAEVFVKGPGAGREAAIRAIDAVGVRVSRIQDLTPVPHNGCRPPKRRRV